jgi:hypothetical protein
LFTHRGNYTLWEKRRKRKEAGRSEEQNE